MRKRRILSLLLAVAVTATMLVAVPLTASANYSDTDNLITWDFGEYTEQQDLQPTGDNRVDTAPTLEYRGLTIYGNTKGPGTNSNDGSDKAISDYVSTKGFHGNGASSTSTRYITYKPTNNGTLTVYFSNNGTSSARWVGVAKNSVKLNTEDPDIIAYGYSVNPPDGESVKTSIEAKDLTAGTEYYIFFGAGAQTISKITYAYTSSGTEPEPGGGDGDEVTIEALDKPQKSNVADYIDWTFHSDSDDIITSSLNENYKTRSESMKDYVDSVMITFTDISSASISNSYPVAGETFTLPHTAHTGGTSHKVAQSAAESSLTIDTALPDECGFDSYDLIFVYNDAEDNADTETKLTVSDPDGNFSKDYTDKDGNSRKTDPAEVIFKNLTSKKIKLTWDKKVNIYSISIDYHNAGAAAETKVVTAAEAEVNNGNHEVPTVAFDPPLEAYTDEYKNIFGENFSKAGNKSVGWINGTSTYVKTDYTIDKPGNYRVYVLAEYPCDNIFTLKKKDGDTVVENGALKRSEQVGKITTRDYAMNVYTYDLYDLEAGVYEFTYTANGQASDFIAMAIAPIGITWGSTGTDSGYYMEGDSKLGVIRFFQSVNANDVIDYGFYVVKSDGTIVDSARTNSEEKAAELTGIYGDLYGLPNESASDAEAQSTYSMKAFVTLKGSDNPVFAPESIKDQKVNWDVRVTDTIPSE